MFRGALEPWHVIIILLLVIVVFGSRKLPDAARSLGQSLRIFKSEMKAAAKDDQPVQSSAVPTPPQAVEGKVVTQPADSVPHSTGAPQA
jgi:sec-independent protein translocase protein TatA